MEECDYRNEEQQHHSNSVSVMTRIDRANKLADICRMQNYLKRAGDSIQCYFGEIDNDAILEYEIENDYKTLDDVRIMPAKIVFNNVYEGKMFEQSFRILNAGKYPALIRIFPPSSKTFKMKPMLSGQYIAAGMSITKKISYSCSRALCVAQANITIYINEKPLDYDVEVSMSTSVVVMRPKELNFGDIDIGTASEQKEVLLKNVGYKTTTFNTDLGKTDLEIIVDPTTGTINPGEIIVMKLELLGTHEGSFHKEFWIKTEPPQRLRISGTFIQPRLAIEHPLSDYSITLIDFPTTYYGASNTRILVIRNASSRPTMFCMVFEDKMQTMNMKTAFEVNPNMKSFYINPIEGRLQANHRFIVYTTFTPKKIKTRCNKQSIVFVEIKKISYRGGVVQDKDVEVKTFSCTSREDDLYSIASLGTESASSHVLVDAVYVESKLRLCLYGEIEEASVTLQPDAFEMTDLPVGVPRSVTFNIKNNSKHLPVTVKYNKEPCVELEPCECTLKPDGSVDVLLTLKPSKMGAVKLKILFTLTYRHQDKVFNVGSAKMYLSYTARHDSENKKITGVMRRFNPGITPLITNEVGILVDDVKFSTNIHMPIQAIVDKRHSGFHKDNDAFIAFPNDRPQSLRPWRESSPIKTIFAGIPRVGVPSYLTRPKTLQKKRLLSNGPVAVKCSSEHDISGVDPRVEKALMEGICKPFHIEVKEKVCFIPLRPEMLMAVTITPQYIVLGKIAPYTVINDFFTIDNGNSFPIEVNIKALSNTVVIKGKQRMVIGPNSQTAIYFDCYSYGLGRYYVPVYIVINDCHIFDATVFAEVVPMTVKCKEKEVFINPTTNTALFEMYNPVNCNVSYSAEMQESCFKIVPSSGIIAPRSGMAVKLTFIPEIDAPNVTEMYVLSESGSKQIIKVMIVDAPHSVTFSTEIVEFQNIPLNVPVSQDLVLRNHSDRSVAVVITNPKPMSCIEITPTQGILKAKCYLFIKINVHCRMPINFTCMVRINVSNHDFSVRIRGNVSWPYIVFEPNFLQIPKIPANAYQRRGFCVINMSQALTKVKFDLTTFYEFDITDIEGQLIKEEISLEPGQGIQLFLEFKPIEPSAYTMYLPYIMNDLIGPVRMNDPKSLDANTYFSPNTEEQSLFVKSKKMLAYLRLGCSTGVPWISVTPLHIDFLFYNGCELEQFHLTNVSSTEQKVGLLYVDYEDQPFVIYNPQGKMLGRYYQMVVEPGEKVVFTIEFIPEKHGTYKVEIPIMVEGFFKDCPYNHITLTGTHPNPTICTKPIVVFGTLVVNGKRTRPISLNLTAHLQDCRLCVTNETNFFDVVFEEIEVTKEPKYTRTVNVKITFQPYQEGQFSAQLVFHCSCGGSCKLLVKGHCCNSMILNYDQYIQTKDKDRYVFILPYFPTVDDSEYMYNEMTDVLEIVHKWLFNQGFFYSRYYVIPETIRRYAYEEKEKTVKRKKNEPSTNPFLPLQKLLVNLLDSSVLNYTNCSNEFSPSEDDLEGTAYDYLTYKNILNFLVSLNVPVILKRPEFLLPYKRYLIFKEKFTDSDSEVIDDVYPLTDFENLSKVHWMNLILKIYKVLVFDRAFHEPREEVDVFHEEFMAYCEIHRSEYAIPDVNEVTLLMWLNFIFEKQKSILWPNTQINKLPIKDIGEDGFRDGLLLAALMMAYCPYLQENFRYFYVTGANDGQLFHNACLITESWNKLHLSFDMDTYEVIRPRPMEMVMLLTYLYGILPHFYPKETITVNALMADSSAYQLSLTNCSEAAIAYTPALFHNEREEFRIDSSVIVIHPNQKKTIKIMYTAKHIGKSNTVLILSGETRGYKYARSKAYNLLGIPDVRNVSQEFTINLTLYERFRRTFPIESPYKTTYEAAIHGFFDVDGSGLTDDLDGFISMQELNKVSLPRQWNTEPFCIFNDEGKCKLSLNLCFLLYGNFTCYLFFANESVGDFCVRLNIVTTLSNSSYEIVKVPVYKTFNPNAKCQCWKSMNESCPLVITAEVPQRNAVLLEGIREMFQMVGDVKETDFWNKHLVFPKGFVLLRNYLDNTYEEKLTPFKVVLNEKVSYSVKSLTDHFYCEDLLVKDTTSERSKKLPLHWNCNSFPSEEIVTLLADHGREIRQYMLVFQVK